MLNLLGLGFAFSAVDKGLSKFLFGTNEGFLQLGKTFESVSKAAGRFTSDGMQLTSGVEAQFKEMTADAKSAAVRLGRTGDAATKMSKEVTDAAFAMNRSVGAVSDAFAGFHRDEEAMGLIGVKSFKDLAKAADVAGFDANKFASSIARLRGMDGLKGLVVDGKYTNDALVKLIGAMQLAGERTENMSGAVEMLNDVTGLLARAQAAGVQDVAAYGRGIFQTAVLFKHVTKDGTEALNMAKELSEQFISSQEAAKGLISGLGSDLSSLTLTLGLTQGGIDKAIAEMQTGPAGMIKSMVELAEESKRSGKDVTRTFEFIRAQLAGVLGAPMAAVLKETFEKEGVGGLRKLANEMESTAGDLNKFKKQFDTRLTDAEKLKRAEDIFHKRFRSMAKDSDKWLSTVRNNFKAAGDTMEALVKEGGPLGDLVSTLADVDRRGLVALLPEQFQAIAPVLGLVAKTVVDAAAGFEALGISLTDVFTPLKLVLGASAAIAVLFLKNKTDIAANTKLWEKYGNTQERSAAIAAAARQKTVEDVGKFARGIAAKIDEFVADAPDLIKTVTQVFEEIGPAIKSSFGAIWKIAKPYVEAAIDSALEFLRGVWDGFMDPTAGGETGSISTKIGLALGQMIGRGWEMAKPFVAEAFTTFLSWLGTFIANNAPKIAAAIIGAMQTVYNAVEKENPMVAKLLAGYLGYKAGGEGITGFLTGLATPTIINSDAANWTKFLLNPKPTLDSLTKPSKFSIPDGPMSQDPNTLQSMQDMTDHLQSTAESSDAVAASQPTIIRLLDRIATAVTSSEAVQLYPNTGYTPSALAGYVVPNPGRGN